MLVEVLVVLPTFSLADAEDEDDANIKASADGERMGSSSFMVCGVVVCSVVVRSVVYRVSCLVYRLLR